jgi:antagonist of KipI
MKGGSYRFSEDSIIALTGLGSAEINSNQIEFNSTVKIKKGDVLNVNSNNNKRYSYLSIQGKIEAQDFWGSYSTYDLMGKGGFEGRKLERGDVLSITKTEKNGFFYEANDTISLITRIMRAPEFDQFSYRDHSLIVERDFTVSVHSNRMGYRLNECVLESTKTGNIISSGCIPGTIQVPASGAPIVLMADSPTIGGYPRIGVIHPEDFGSFAQKIPGDTVKFEWFEI